MCQQACPLIPQEENRTMRGPLLASGQWSGALSVLISSQLPPFVPPIMQGVGKTIEPQSCRSLGEHLIANFIRKLGLRVVK